MQPSLDLHKWTSVHSGPFQGISGTLVENDPSSNSVVLASGNSVMRLPRNVVSQKASEKEYTN